jgi:NitT/TauT family transport system substrate-binding protein
VTRLRVLLNSYHSGANAWFALAGARGHFLREGLDVVMTPGSGAYRTVSQLVEQDFDLAFGDMGALIALHGGGLPAPVGVLAIHHTSPSAIAVRRGGPIREPHDLIGRRLITHASDVAYRAFPAFADAVGVDLAGVRVEIREEPMAGMMRMLLDGAADGVFGYVSSQKAVLREIDPGLAEALAFLSFPAFDPDPYGSVVMAGPKAMASKPDAITACLKALNASLIEAVLEPAAAVEAVLACNPALDRSVELARWRETIAGELTHDETRSLGFGAVDASRLARAIARQARTQALPVVPQGQAVFDDTFLPAFTERMRLTEAIIRS